MKVRPGKPCIGCARDGHFTIVNDGTSWCQQHTFTRRNAYTHPDYLALKAKLTAVRAAGAPIMCAYCRVRPATQPDHAVALAHGGAHDATNLVPSCQRCNQGKNAGGHDG